MNSMQHEVWSNMFLLNQLTFLFRKEAGLARKFDGKNSHTFRYKIDRVFMVDSESQEKQVVVLRINQKLNIKQTKLLNKLSYCQHSSQLDNELRVIYGSVRF